MGKQKPARTEDRSADVLVKQNGKAEKRLLRRERRAEQLLTEARARLHKAQLRLERRLSAVSDAESLLRTRQAARGAGPNESNGASAETVPAASAPATEKVAPAGRAAKAAARPAIVAENVAAVKSDSPSAKPPARRRTRKPAAAKEQAS